MASIRTQLPMFSAIQWLSDGFSDMRATQFKGTYYGLVFTLVAFIISFIYATYWKATMGLTASFFLMGPIILHRHLRFVSPTTAKRQSELD